MLAGSLEIRVSEKTNFISKSMIKIGRLNWLDLCTEKLFRLNIFSNYNKVFRILINITYN